MLDSAFTLLTDKEDPGTGVKINSYVLTILLIIFKILTINA
jgi:hypothetical protein